MLHFTPQPVTFCYGPPPVRSCWSSMMMERTRGAFLVRLPVCFGNRCSNRPAGQSITRTLTAEGISPSFPVQGATSSSGLRIACLPSDGVMLASCHEAEELVTSEAPRSARVVVRRVLLPLLHVSVYSNIRRRRGVSPPGWLDTRVVTLWEYSSTAVSIRTILPEWLDPSTCRESPTFFLASQARAVEPGDCIIQPLRRPGDSRAQNVTTCCCSIVQLRVV